MRILRILLLIIFVITAGFFGYDQYRSYKDKDNIPPVISSAEEVIHLNIDSSDDELLKGVSAIDEKDGDVSSTLVIAGKSNFIEDGVIRVDYAAFDSHSNVGTYSRRAIYDGYHSPRFSSEKALVLRSESSYDFSFFQAFDVLEGDISNKIKVLSETYATDTYSEYPVDLEVTNSYGDVEKLSLVLDILSGSEYNRQSPALSEYIIYVPVGAEPDLKSYLVGIRQGDRVLDFEATEFSLEDIELEDNTDYNTPGKYTAVFLMEVSKTITTETKMIVIVTEDY